MADERFSIGFRYPMDVELSQLVPIDEGGKPAVASKVFLDYLHLSYIDSGSMQVVVEDTRNGREQTFRIKSDFGKPLGSIHSLSDRPVYNVYTETGRRHVGARGRTETIKVKLQANGGLPVRISSVEQTGTSLNES